MIIKDESYYSVQDKVLSDDNKFLLIFKQLNVTACDPSDPLKFKYLTFVNK